jgi:hypothetical protein
MHTRLWVRTNIFCRDRNGAFSWLQKNRDYLIKQNDSFGINWRAKNLEKLLRIVQNVIDRKVS